MFQQSKIPSNQVHKADCWTLDYSVFKDLDGTVAFCQLDLQHRPSQVA